MLREKYFKCVTFEKLYLNAVYIFIFLLKDFSIPIQVV